MRIRITVAGALAAGVASAPAFGQVTMGPMNMGLPAMPAIYAGQADKPGAPIFAGLGEHHHVISTHNAHTQLLFDQGVNLLFGFNHAEAIRSFREAARFDPDCAMCWWGVAFALGPNINMPMPPDAVAPAWQALQRARVLAPKASPEERDWIAALSTRYSPDPKADRAALDAAFADAMGDLARAHPEDLDAAVFHAEAMMDTQPWDYWQTDGVTPKGHALEIVATLEGVIARAPNHPGALHLYIHAVEATTTPQRAEAAADRLEKLMPGAGHIVHMPSHIYYRVGRFADSVKVNELAARVDEGYIAECRAQGFYPVGYYGHNIHFLWASSEMQGRYAAAIDAARRLQKVAGVAEASAKLPPAELYTFTPVATELRFGKWASVLAEPPPGSSLTLSRAVWLHARAFAHASLGDMTAAQADRDEIARLISADFTRYDAFGIPARSMVSMALALASGEIARKAGRMDEAVRRFQDAAALEKSLAYTEPPYWHQPVSHLLGAALLEAGRPAEAEAVYRASLAHTPGDGWALFGLASSLDTQGRESEAQAVRADQRRAFSMADVTLASSRF